MPNAERNLIILFWSKTFGRNLIEPQSPISIYPDTARNYEDQLEKPSSGHFLRLSSFNFLPLAIRINYSQNWYEKNAFALV